MICKHMSGVVVEAKTRKEGMSWALFSSFFKVSERVESFLSSLSC